MPVVYKTAEIAWPWALRESLSVQGRPCYPLLSLFLPESRICPLNIKHNHLVLTNTELRVPINPILARSVPHPFQDGIYISHLLHHPLLPPRKHGRE